MKMSIENYKKFKWFYDYTLENATDRDIEVIFYAIAHAAEILNSSVKKEKKKK